MKKLYQEEYNYWANKLFKNAVFKGPPRQAPPRHDPQTCRGHGLRAASGVRGTAVKSFGIFRRRSLHYFLSIVANDNGDA